MAAQLMCASGLVSVAHRLNLLQGRGFGRQERRRRRAANGRREVRPARPCHMNIARTHVHLSLLPWQVCTRLLMHDCSSDGCSSDNCSSGAAAARTLAGCSCDTAARPMWLAYATCVAAARGRRDDYSCDGCSCDGCSCDGSSSDVRQLPARWLHVRRGSWMYLCVCILVILQV